MADPSSTLYVTIGNPTSISIERLSATNWLAWKNRISDVVEANNWRKYIDGTSVAPEASVAAPVTGISEEDEDTSPRGKWLTKDRLIMMHLKSAISDQQLLQIGSVASSAQLWRRLRELKEPTGLAAITNAIAMIYETRCTEDSQIDKHITRIRNYAIQLGELGEAFPDYLLATIYMRSLPSSYKLFVNSFWGTQSSSHLKTIKSEDVIM